jgi:uncharacterized protein YecT (DUF1311 family)
MNSSLILMLSLALAAPAQNAPDESWEKICRDVQAQPLIEPGISGPLKESQLPTCNARALYYGFGSSPNYPAALQCSWYQRTHSNGNGNSADMFGATGVLTMLYANGRGIPRNYDFAIRFACEQPFAAPNEMKGRIANLRRMKAANSEKDVFDLCDDATSGMSMGFCESIQQEKQDAERARKRAVITAKLTPPAKILYDKLYAAESKFEETRVSSEIDMSGSARGMFLLQDQGKLRDQFIINLDRFGKGDIPQASAEDAKKLDAEMNAVYQRLMQLADSAYEAGTVKREGVRDTQRAWLQLRDAWMAFAKPAYPKLSADRVMAQLIRLRLHQLQLLPIDVN